MAGMQASRQTLLAMMLLVAPVTAPPPPPEKPTPVAKDAYPGAALFRTYCASCHGPLAKGDGPLAGQLRIRPPDLTLIAGRNKGKWDGGSVARTIDGREPVKGHGGPDMPVWGDVFKSSRDGYDEESVKVKVRQLMEYLESLQVTRDRR